MKKNEAGDPVVYGVLHIGDKSHVVKCFSWLAFLFRINEIMRETEVRLPFGESEELRMVVKPNNNVERSA